jgi:hypothetical protein
MYDMIYILLYIIFFNYDIQKGEEAVNNKLSVLEAAGSQLKAELQSLTK